MDSDPLGQLAGMRESYGSDEFDFNDLADTPLAEFERWLAAAVAAGIPEPNAMILATSAGGQPSARTVLLKAADPRGFAFFTNATSRKGQELRENPAAALVFPWFAMMRQVVVGGSASELPRAESEVYFRSRPYGSRIGAHASRQSEPLTGRNVLEEEYQRVMHAYPDTGRDTDVPLPDFWGGWIVAPTTVEFWAGRASRLHDRLRYHRVRPGGLDEPAAWGVERLSP